MWEAGTFWLISNRPDKAAPLLRKYLAALPDRQPEVYDLCWKLGLGNNSILASVVPPEYRFQAGYLSYLMLTKRPEEAGEVWKAIDLNRLEQKLFISYVNFLIDNRRYAEAEDVWKDITGRLENGDKDGSTSPIWNAGFEKDMLGGGFGWVAGEAKGAEVYFDDAVRMTGSRSVAVRFDGTENPDITIIRQIVRVSPGRHYRLSGHLKTEALTTSNGLFMSVEGHQCSGLQKRSEVVTGTVFWKEVSVEFEPPKDCGAVVVKVRREKSVKLDNKIAGEAWIDGIRLKLLSD
jgi:hypothetical protein